MKKHLVVIAISLSILFPAVSQAANPYTILMDQKMRQAQHKLDLAKKKKGAEQEKMLKENLSLMKENLQRMSQNMVKMDRQMKNKIRQNKSEHHRQMASLMEAMIQEHIYVLKVLKQMGQGTELRNEILLKPSR